MRRPRTRLAAGICIFTVFLLGLTTEAHAIHEADVVQLDGNQSDDGDGTDWAAMYDSDGLPIGLPPGTQSDVFVFDPVDEDGVDASYFEPSTNDDQVINPAAGGAAWGCEEHQSSDKNEIINTYAVTVVPTSGDLEGDVLMYWGIERFDNSGDAFLGFWFFQTETSCEPAPDGSGFFEGTKTENDILVLADFTDGGDVDSLKALAWHPCDSPADPAQEDPTCNPATDAGYFTVELTEGDCSEIGTDPHDLCGEVNQTGFTTPWTSVDKKKPGNDPDPDANDPNHLEKAEFFEGGINLTSFVGEDVCFGTFLSESRASSSIGATLKDYAMGSLATCGDIRAHKYHDLNADGDDEDGADPPLEDWTICIDEDLEGDCDAGEPQGTTDASGDVLFEDLQAGTYQLCEVLEPDWFNSDPGSSATVPLCKSQAVTVGDEPVVKFGNFQQATKSGRKFEDLNADGDDESGTDPGIEAWNIHAFDDADGDGDLSGDEFTAGPVATAATDSNGDYTLTLDPGLYVVCEDATLTGSTDAWAQSVPSSGDECDAEASLADNGYAIDLDSQEDDSGNDFGNFRQATKSGRKFEDLNADGDDESGTDPGIEGWNIHAFVDADEDGDLSQAEFDAGATTVATDASGDYSFTLDPGFYVICEDASLAGSTDTWFQSLPGSGNECDIDVSLAPNGYGIELTSDEDDSDNDFGNFRQATKSGRKFEDLNADGDDESGTDPAVENLPIYAFVDADEDGDLSQAEFDAGAVTSTLTDVSGNYSLTLDPGFYIVCEAATAGWFQSLPGSGGECDIDVSLAPNGYGIELTSNETDSDNDFGNFRQATKSGRKFEDLNADGDDESGTDPGIEGWNIHAFVDADEDGDLSQAEFDAGATTVATDASGDYSFTLDPGFYVICEDASLAGSTDTWFQSLPGSGNECDIDVSLAPNGYGIELTSDEDDSENDFGNFRQATKSGVKFNDVDGSGSNNGEALLPGWEIRIYHDGDDADTDLDDLLLTDITGGDGSYGFTIDPGDYLVCEVQQVGWEQTAPSSGGDCDVIDPANAPLGHLITLESGEQDSGNDFGNRQPDQGEGCTPGFWRNHTELWDGSGGDDLPQPDATGPLAPYTTGDDFHAVFGVPSGSGSGKSGLSAGITLGETIQIGGGGKKALARHATAALINASLSNDTVDFPMTESEVLDLYQDAIAGTVPIGDATNTFASANEAGCPIT